MVGFMIYNTGSLSAICDPGSRNDTDSPGQIRSKLFFTQNMEISRGLPLPDTRMTRKDGGNIECCLPLRYFLNYSGFTFRENPG